MLEINQTAPDFTLPDLNGRPFGLSSRRGGLVVLNFWSAECPWAARTDALLAEWKPAWDGRVLIVPIASNINESPALLRETAAARGLDGLLVDAGHQVADLYAAETTPHIFVIDEAGRLRYQGGVDDVTFRQRQPTRFYLREALEALLHGQSPPLAQTPAYGCTILRFLPE
jgi:peroxiredoxin